ncbi:MAG: molybdopterin-dependent oxidoreductase [Bacillota bacterium]
MERIDLLLDGKQVTARSGMTILEVALENKVYIPHLCHHPELKPAGVCRLCYVELEGKGPVLSCRTPAKAGMVIKTRSPLVDEIRSGLVELLIADRHDDCPSCAKKGRCELQKIMGYLRVDKKKARRLRFAEGALEPDTSNPFFNLDPNKCVLCGRCVRTCSELLRINAIAVVGRGYRSKVAPLGAKPIAQSSCESCGECVERCPVGGLVYKEYKRPEKHVLTVCPYCSGGCRLTLGLQKTEIVSAQGERLCARGRFGWRYIYAPDRVTAPLARTEGRLVEVSWEDAIRLAATHFARYRGEEIAVVVSAKCTNEEAYLFQKFARSVLKTNNIDNTARLSHAVSLEALWEATGIGAATNSLEELEDAACILMVGANAARTHPAAARKVKEAAEKGSRLIIVDPVENDFRRFAHLWLKPYPGTDLALLMGIAGVIVEEGLLDLGFVEERCENFEELRESLADFPLGRVERLTGVPREMVAEAAHVFTRSKPAAVLWSTGVTQYLHGKDTVCALINLALLTANMGGPSAGLHPLLEQSNAQGACDMGCLPGFYPGYQPVLGRGVREKFEAAWKTELNPDPGLAFTELWDAILDGRIKALYLIGANPLTELPGGQRVLECLERLELLVFQDLFLNETAGHANLVLPAAGFAEKDGTYTTADRRVQRLRKAIEPVGQSLPDGEIIRRIAAAMGATGFDFADPTGIMEEITSLVPGYGGIAYEKLAGGAVVWPAGTTVLHKQAFHRPTGKAKLFPLDYQGPEERPDVEFPLVLVTRRNAPYYGTCAHKVDGFRKLAPGEYLEVSPKDAGDFGLGDGEEVKVISRQGEFRIAVKVTEDPPPGVVVLNYNLPQNPGKALMRREMRACAVRIERLL